MKYDIVRTTQFKKDYKLSKKRGKDTEILKKVITMLVSGHPLPESYMDHHLSGNYTGYRECHIQPDWLLIYKRDGNNLILILSRIGTHSDLF